ncbi:NAD(P)-dependent alcohol dehydrogenase [Nocardioides glacieisoli]
MPGPDEVLLAVRAAGVSRGVWHMMTGLPYIVRLVGGLRRPRRATPGMDVCGDVVQLGSRVSGFQLGQRVFGIARGSFAEYAVAKASHLTPAPPELTDAQAAVTAESGLTALQALDAAGITTNTGVGCRVLVVGAAGGVGSFAVQLAALSGAEVTAVCSGSKAAFTADLGAARIIDYRVTDPLLQGTRYDVILDVAGGRKLSDLRASLAPRGTLVFVGNESGAKWTGGFERPFAYQVRMALRSQRFVNLLVRTDSADLARLADLASRGGLRPRIHASFPLAGVRDALEELTSGSTAGKIALRIDDQDGDRPS